MKVGIYTPFPPTPGGGERYCLTIAEILSQENEVYFNSQFNYDLTIFSEAFNLDLKNITFIKKKGARQFFLPQMIKEYELFVCLSNHIIPPAFPWGKKSILVIQFPFPHPSKKIGDKVQILLKNLKCSSYDLILCYSEFTKKWISTFNSPIKEVLVLPPPIDVSYFASTLKKKNKILSVGRFFGGAHEKRHIEMIGEFKKMLTRGLSGWEYHIAGGLSDKKYFEKVKNRAVGYPIFLYPNISGDELRDLYGRAKIFWHATGLHNDENITPWKSEHFGMSVVEAMSAGGVPVVVNKGALPEFVKHGENGFLFNNLEELGKYTWRLIKDEKLRERLSKNAIEMAKKFDKKVFEKRLLRIINEVMG